MNTEQQQPHEPQQQQMMTEPYSATAEATTQTNPEQDEEMIEVKKRMHNASQEDERPAKMEKQVDEPPHEGTERIDGRSRSPMSRDDRAMAF